MATDMIMHVLIAENLHNFAEWGCAANHVAANVNICGRAMVTGGQKAAKAMLF